MAAPVTVIIATYDWSAALRVSIASVLAQTHREFELLVIGDCCTDDSAEVVRSLEDPRVQWWNLPIRHRSQSGPNNYGIEIASGRFIAYLGHDDVWHPDHLRFSLAKIEETGADMVCGVCIMYGPAGSGVRFVSGMFVEGRYRCQDFLPPSSLMHRRDLTARIGPWGRPEDLSAPVDCDLLERAFQAGACIVSTERLTVFKFNSAWRRNSYLRRDVSEQQRMLERLTTAPALCVEEEWAGLLRARREHRLFESSMPDASDHPPGFRHSALLRARGLENVDSDELLTLGRFTMDAQDSAMDWHAPEQVEEWGSCRWTGPSPTALITLPIRLASRARFRLQILNWLGIDLAEDVSLSVAGVKLDFTCRANARRVSGRALAGRRIGGWTPPSRDRRRSAAVPLLRIRRPKLRHPLARRVRELARAHSCWLTGRPPPRLVWPMRTGAHGGRARRKLDLPERLFVLRQVFAQDPVQRLRLRRAQIDPLKGLDLHLFRRLVSQPPELQEEVPQADPHLDAIGVLVLVAGLRRDGDPGLLHAFHAPGSPSNPSRKHSAPPFGAFIIRSSPQGL